MTARIKEQYSKDVVPRLIKERSYPNVMAVPRLKKVVVNMGVGEATQNIKLLDAAMEELGKITGQRLAADAGPLAALPAHDLDVAGVDGRLALGDAALDVALRVGPRVPLDEAHSLHDHPVLLGQDLEDLALLAGVAAGDHQHGVVLLEARARGRGLGGGGHG